MHDQRPVQTRAIDLPPKEFRTLVREAVISGVFWALFGWALLMGFLACGARAVAGSM
jgi:hypothetical protein